MNVRLTLAVVAALVVGFCVPLAFNLLGDSGDRSETSETSASAGTSVREASTRDEKAKLASRMGDVVDERLGPEATAEAFAAALTTFDARSDRSERAALDRASAYATENLHASLVEALSSRDAPMVWQQMVDDRARSEVETAVVSADGDGDQRDVTVKVRQRVKTRTTTDTHEFRFALTLQRVGERWVVVKATW